MTHKLQLKKYQTQNFVNQYLQQNNKKYTAKMRGKALIYLKKKGFKEFEFVFIKTNLERLTQGAKIVARTLSNAFDSIAEFLIPIVENIYSEPKSHLQYFRGYDSAGVCYPILGGVA